MKLNQNHSQNLKKGYQKVLEFFLTDLDTAQTHTLSKRDFLKARRNYNYCFNIQSSGPLINITFQVDFHQYFENRFKDKRPTLITLDLVD